MKLILTLCLLALPVCAQSPTPTPLDKKGLMKSYAALIKAHYPEHRDILVEVLPVFFGDDLLFASHPLFGRYEFKYGPLVDEVWKWIVKHRDELKAAKIAEVGCGRERLSSGSPLLVKDAFPKPAVFKY